MIDERQVFERVMRGFVPPDDSLERLVHRRDRKRRNQRIAAGVVGITVFAAAIWIVTTGATFDRTTTPAVPGPVETGPTVTGPTETGQKVTYDAPKSAVGPVPRPSTCSISRPANDGAARQHRQ
jgi:hypothetical protein